MATLTDPAKVADGAVAAIRAAADQAALDATRAKYVGRKDGELTRLLRNVPALPPAERPAYGAAVNKAKARVEAALEERAAALRGAALERD
ncbi:MAG TPA: hypothetical protein VFM93_03880, partial [Candidatus Limnocylindria bacterium]|nr:hypothetical protein [Candidatus Limnocylindria bacterium]